MIVIHAPGDSSSEAECESEAGNAESDCDGTLAEKSTIAKRRLREIGERVLE
jgi:hypothetical protein